MALVIEKLKKLTTVFNNKDALFVEKCVRYEIRRRQSKNNVRDA